VHSVVKYRGARPDASFLGVPAGRDPAGTDPAAGVT
jgi:hypothetical protein